MPNGHGNTSTGNCLYLKYFSEIRAFKDKNAFWLNNITLHSSGFLEYHVWNSNPKFGKSYCNVDKFPEVSWIIIHSSLIIRSPNNFSAKIRLVWRLEAAYAINIATINPTPFLPFLLKFRSDRSILVATNTSCHGFTKQKVCKWEGSNWMHTRGTADRRTHWRTVCVSGRRTCISYWCVLPRVCTQLSIPFPIQPIKYFAHTSLHLVPCAHSLSLFKSVCGSGFSVNRTILRHILC